VNYEHAWRGKELCFGGDAFAFLILRGLELSACMYLKEFWSVEIKGMLLINTFTIIIACTFPLSH